jgi:putative ABC transport system ATP-binding protein
MADHRLEKDLSRLIKMEVTVKNLVKAYKVGKVEVQALRGINLEVEKGDIVSIIGSSGSGKTTLLNIIGGLDTATAGYVKVGETEVTALSIPQLVEYRRRVVGHVFQTLNLVPTLSAAENVGLAMIALGKSKGEREKRVAELLEIIGLTDRATHKPEELSGGEQQRVALAAALANDPELILADEPTGELDTMNSKIVVDYLRKVNQELGKTIILVTHDPSVARSCNRILRIEDGVIKAETSPTRIEEGEIPLTIIDYLKNKIAEIDGQVAKLEADFKADKMTSDAYVAAKLKLSQTRESFKEELHKLGVTVT